MASRCVILVLLTVPASVRSLPVRMSELCVRNVSNGFKKGLFLPILDADFRGKCWLFLLRVLVRIAFFLCVMACVFCVSNRVSESEKKRANLTKGHEKSLVNQLFTRLLKCAG